MNNIQLRTQQLEQSKQKFVLLLKEGKIEQANSIVRDASFICNHLGRNVITEFAMLLKQETGEFRQAVEQNYLKCPHCDWSTVLGKMSLNAHVGRKHKGK